MEMKPKSKARVTCEWEPHCYENKSNKFCGYYYTSCEYVIKGDKDFKWCPYCGKKIEVKE